MGKICNYCGYTCDNNSKVCPICGSQLSIEKATSSRCPITIKELQEWYVSHNLPPEKVTRFFIGKDITEPKAFGIYKNSAGLFVVYKNKANGERAIRYQGNDEAYAVGELFQKLREEIAKQKARNAAKRRGAQQQPWPTSTQQSYDSSLSSSGNANLSNTNSLSDRNANSLSGDSNTNANASNSQILLGGCKSLLDDCKNILGKIATIVIVFFLTIIAYKSSDKVPNGYYKYNGKEYYHQGSSWFLYNRLNDTWSKSESMSDYITEDNAQKYKFSGHIGTDFEDTQWYDDDTWSNDDDDSWDNDNDSWDNDDDWDNSSTNWDDDW